MSATLEPIDVYSKTTGIGSCISPADVEGKDERVIAVQEDEDHSDWHRGVVTRKYPLRFPQKNRLSVIVDRDRYTYSNRKKKDTTRSSMTKTREEYLESLINITQSKGNVLICMPSYGEASWAKTMLEENISKEVLLDQSSASAETDETLEEFFSGDGKVLCTSTRGTITEGVDYDGDKLSVCAVVGISLLPPSDRNKAVEYAYDEELDGVSGRDATNKIPAVRKARQAYGRVLRGDEEKGVRVLVDERYGETRYGGVNQYLGDGERDEFEVMSDAEFSKRMRLFWESVE
jgi:DNA excision repair protein ERCC-2